jgi:hypothetical protein
MHAEIGINPIITEFMPNEILSAAARCRFDQVRWRATPRFSFETVQKLTRRTLTRNNQNDCLT